MTTSGNDAPDPAGGDEPAATAGRAHRHRRAALAAAAIAVGVLVLGVLVRIGQDQAETSPLDADAPALAGVTFHTDGCIYEPERGGLVVHFAVSTHDAGRFTVDVAAVTDEGADNLDITTPHVVRYTVPFYGGPSRQEFDVVVPLNRADYQQGYRKCRFTTVNGSE